MARFNVGDPVTVVAREQTPSDLKSGLYYPHMGGMQGAVLKVYGEEASVTVERDSLEESIRLRHNEIERGMRQKWLDGLSEEARGKLSEKEKNFALGYTVLVSMNDLVARDPNIPIAAPAARPTRDARDAAKESAIGIQSVNPLTGDSDVNTATRLPDTAPRNDA